MSDALVQATHSGVTVRWAGPGDLEVIRRVAQLDSKRMPSGAMLVAEEDGRILAVRPVNGVEAIADPFHPTRHLVDLLELRAAQIATDGREKGRGVAALWLSRRLLAGGRDAGPGAVAHAGAATGR